MDISAALGDIVKIVGGGKNVVVHHVRTMCHFNHQVTVIVVVEVFADTGALCLPVKPGTKGTVMDIIVMDLYVNGCVQLDACNLVTEILMFYGNVVNMVIVDLAEYTSHMAYTTVLSAVINDIIPDNMGADLFFAPANLQGAEHSFHLVLVTWFSVSSGAEVVACGGFFADADTAAFCVVDDIVFNDPALAPVGAYKTRLVSGWRCPRAGGLCHLKAPHGDIIHTCLLWVEAAFAHIDLSQFFVRVSALEIGINICIIMVCLSISLMDGPLFIFDRFRMFCPRRVVPLCADLGIFHVVKGFGFIK